MADNIKIRVRCPQETGPFSAPEVDVVQDQESADLVVLNSSELSMGRTDSGKPIYVLLEHDSYEERERAWKSPGVIGCSPWQADGLPEELRRILGAMIRRRTEEATAEAAVTPETNSPGENSFVTLTYGRMRGFMADLNDALEMLIHVRTSWGLPEDAKKRFCEIPKAQWLDVVHARYSPPTEERHKKALEDLEKQIFDAIMKKGKGRATSKSRLSKADRNLIIERFGELFGWSSEDLSEVPGYRPINDEKPKIPGRWQIPSLLIEGETGTGKTLLAQYIRERLGSVPFRPVTCTNIPENLLESELFGALAGAYTGANVTKEGRVVAAYGGVVFLDEIGDLPVQLQVKLLALLNEGFIEPDGWVGPALHIPVVIIAATNRHLPHLIKEKQFRDDLYYRFTRRVFVPPLRQRLRDLEQLAAIVLGRACRAAKVDPLPVSREALSSLKAYAFPGNFRELESVLGNAVRHARRAGGRMILPEDLHFEALRPGTTAAAFILPAKKHGGQWEVLLIWNDQWADYHFLGDQHEPSAEEHEVLQTLEAAVRRKTGIEVKAEDVRPAGGVMETTRLSDTTGDQQWYRFRFFRVTTQAITEQLFALTTSGREATPGRPPRFVVATDTDIEKGFVCHRSISEAVRECWQRLQAEGALEVL